MSDAGRLQHVQEVQAAFSLQVVSCAAECDVRLPEAAALTFTSGCTVVGRQSVQETETPPG